MSKRKRGVMLTTTTQMQNDRDHFRKHSSHASPYDCTEPRAHMVSAAPFGRRTPCSATRPPHTPAAGRRADSGVAHRSAIRQPHALQRHSAAAYARSATAAAHARSAIQQRDSTATPIG